MRSLYSSSVCSVALAVVAAGCTIVASGPGAPGYVSSGTAALEVNVNRVGSDYRSFEVTSGRPEECRDTCMTEPQCLAFTFVNPGVQGPNPVCWLKSAVPAPTPDNCCVSGAKNAPPPSTGYADAPPADAPPPAPAAAAPPTQEQWNGQPPPREARGLEMNVTRNGSDYANFDLREPRPHLCKDACMRDGRCRAFTYVNPGVQGANARCWLKDQVPPPTPDACCVSGIKAERGHGSVPPPRAAGLEASTNRAGSDFSNFDLPEPNPELCRDACLRDGRCRAFTYANPGVQGSNARCWLKNAVPPATPDGCCVSGVK